MRVKYTYFEKNYTREDINALRKLDMLRANNAENENLVCIIKRIRARIKPQHSQNNEAVLDHTFYDHPELFCMRILKIFENKYPEYKVSEFYMRRPDNGPYNPDTILWIRK